ncbi:MAG: type I DNA topoisomerase, partial [Dehalococcoidia bacterium]
MPATKTGRTSRARATKSPAKAGKRGGQRLVVVESPAKARTLGKILGRSYSIKASLGHVRDLPKSEIGVDVDNDFTPKYVIPTQKKKTIAEIKKAAADAGAIYLATDPDREGEAISWHLVQAAGMDKGDTPVHRVVFHEISEDAVRKAFEQPRDLDEHLVNAQQARRILDRLVGYKLSPLLWRKVQRGLSAGRVQSVVVKMIVDREREVQDFVPQEYWIVEVRLAPRGDRRASFAARVVSLLDGTALDIGNKDHADRVVADLETCRYTVKSVQTKQVPRQPAPPFTTSTLQQEASRKLRFTAPRTMAIAQQLYEGLPLGKAGSVGLITYMRTDSTGVSASAISEARAFIGEEYGPEFVPPKPRAFARKAKWAQEAHEAIRPTDIRRQPQHLKPFLNPAQLKLYELIWKRMVASQMSAAVYDTTTVQIQATGAPADQDGGPAAGYLLKAGRSTVRFRGFMTVYSEGRDEDEEVVAPVSLPTLEDGEELTYLGVVPEQCFTQPPPFYTEATLIRALEQKGIGRPSTYAPILSTIQEREYVSRTAGKFRPTELGIVVNGILTEHFPRVVDTAFTARMEKQLDGIAEGQYEWVVPLREFYPGFQATLDEAMTNVTRVSLTRLTEEICPNCDRPMAIKMGRFGKFLACSGYPECKTTRRYIIKTGALCPECGGPLVERMSKKNKTFYGCGNYPECRFATNRRPVARPCTSSLPQAGQGRATGLRLV